MYAHCLTSGEETILTGGAQKDHSEAARMQMRQEMGKFGELLRAAGFFLSNPDCNHGAASRSSNELVLKASAYSEALLLSEYTQRQVTTHQRNLGANALEEYLRRVTSWVVSASTSFEHLMNRTILTEMQPHLQHRGLSISIKASFNHTLKIEGCTSRRLQKSISRSWKPGINPPESPPSTIQLDPERRRIH